MSRRAEIVVPNTRAVAYVDETMFVPDHGFRVSLVFEGENVHRPTGTWPYNGKPGEKMPWFWGQTIEEARAACDSFNERNGISKKEAFIIIARSMSSAKR